VFWTLTFHKLENKPDWLICYFCAYNAFISNQIFELNVCLQVFRLYFFLFQSIKKMSTLYYTNTLSWILIVLAHWNSNPGRHAASLGHIILIPRQADFAPSPWRSMFSGEIRNTNFSLWFDPTGVRTHDLPHLELARSTSCHWVNVPISIFLGQASMHTTQLKYPTV
jgi:hypothetical protein